MFIAGGTQRGLGMRMRTGAWGQPIDVPTPWAGSNIEMSIAGLASSTASAVRWLEDLFKSAKAKTEMLLRRVRRQASYVSPETAMAIPKTGFMTRADYAAARGRSIGSSRQVGAANLRVNPDTQNAWGNRFAMAGIRPIRTQQGAIGKQQLSQGQVLDLAGTMQRAMRRPERRGTSAQALTQAAAEGAYARARTDLSRELSVANRYAVDAPSPAYARPADGLAADAGLERIRALMRTLS
jgi:hypothetical protein